MSHKPEPWYMSQLDAAELLGCTTRHIRALIARGELAAYRVGSSRMVRIKRADVDALMRRIPTVGDAA